MNGLLYLIQLNIYLVLFYGLYLLLLRNETFFMMNRLYLMGSTLLAIAIPLMKAQWIKDLFVTEQISEATHKVSKTLTTVVSGRTEVSWVQSTNHSAIEEVHKEAFLTANQVIWLLYGVVVTLLLLNFVRKLYLVNKAFRTNSSYKAFSFFNKVLVDEQLRGRETIMDHEMVHVRQWHTLDVIFLELFAAFNWFNPVAFAYKRAIRNIHEFIADETAAATLEHKSEYAILLVSNAFGTQSQKLTNSFYNHSLLKKRLIMLNKNKSQKIAILKYGLSAPLFALMIVLSSATIEKSEAVKAITSGIENGLPIVIETLSNGAIPAKPNGEVVDNELPLVTGEEQKAVEPLLTEIIKSDSGALDSIWRHFARKTRYPAIDQEDRKVGSNYVTFALDAEGKIQNLSVVQAMSEGSKAEVFRVAKIAEPFGQGLAGKYIMPIKYQLNIGVGNSLTAPEESFDYTKYAGYQKVKELIIRGYVKLTPEESTEEMIRKYFATNLKYPAEAFKNKLMSRSAISFELDQSGKIVNPSHIQSNGEPFENEVLRVFRTGKTFEGALPGKYILQIIFIIYGKDPKDYNTSFKDGVFPDYKRLTPLIISGSVNASSPDSIKTEGAWQGLRAAFRTYSITSVEEGETVANYIKADFLKNPIILVNGKEVAYKITDKGFKLDKPLASTNTKMFVYTGEDAVKNCKESARKRGLIVVTTE